VHRQAATHRPDCQMTPANAKPRCAASERGGLQLDVERRTDPDGLAERNADSPAVYAFDRFAEQRNRRTVLVEGVDQQVLRDRTVGVGPPLLLPVVLGVAP